MPNSKRSAKEEAKRNFLVNEFTENGVVERGGQYVRPYFRKRGGCLYRAVNMSGETGRDRRSPANKYRFQNNVSDLDITNVFYGVLTLIKAGKI